MASESPKCDCSCSCDNSYDNHSSSPLLPPFKVTTSEFSISLKEIIILSMILFLLLYSIFAFLKHWKRNYYDISTSCQFNSQINDSGVIAPLAREEGEPLSRSESRMSRIVRAKSVMEKSRSRSSQ